MESSKKGFRQEVLALDLSFRYSCVLLGQLTLSFSRKVRIKLPHYLKDQAGH